LFRELRGGLLPVSTTDPTLSVTATMRDDGVVNVGRALGTLVTALPPGALDQRVERLEPAELIAAIVRPRSTLSITFAALHRINAHLQLVAPTSGSAGLKLEEDLLLGVSHPRAVLDALRKSGGVLAAVDAIARYPAECCIVEQAGWALSALVQDDSASFADAADAGALVLLIRALQVRSSSGMIRVPRCWWW
jgi:hypothetical protein